MPDARGAVLESVTFYEETDEFVILGYVSGFYIRKSAFQSESEIDFLKSLVQIKALALRQGKR